MARSCCREARTSRLVVSKHLHSSLSISQKVSRVATPLFRDSSSSPSSRSSLASASASPQPADSAPPNLLSLPSSSSHHLHHHRPHLARLLSCKASTTLTAEPVAAAKTATTHLIAPANTSGTGSGAASATSRVGASGGALPQGGPCRVEEVDVAVVGAGVAGLAAALAASRALPGARVRLYDSASEPPSAPRGGGTLLSVNGLRALRALLDPALYDRLTGALGLPLHEALWFDMLGEMVRRTPYGRPRPLSGLIGGSSSSRSISTKGASGVAPEPDPAAPPLMVGLHELREALAEALPPDVEIFGGHNVCGVEGGGGGGSSAGGGLRVHFATRSGGPPVRSICAKLLIGADGPTSAVKRLLFDSGSSSSSSASLTANRAAQPPQPAPTSRRTVWQGRFTLRPRDPDFASLRRFTTASRTWVDLRAPAGCERSATLSPVGRNTFVWTASCPTGHLATRGLLLPRQENEQSLEVFGSSLVLPYWRCMAMFEDFPQDFFAVLRATPAAAVTEHVSPVRQLNAAEAMGLMAPWQWVAGGTAALVGRAVYDLPTDDAASTAVNLALEDAAVLGACMAQYGMTSSASAAAGQQRALQEYARLRAPRVSAMLAASPSARERVRLRNEPFLAALPAAEPTRPQPQPHLATGPGSVLGSGSTAAAAVTREPTGDAAVTAAVMRAAAAAAAHATQTHTPSTTPTPDFGRPSGGAARVSAAGDSSAVPSPAVVRSPAGPSSPLFSRPAAGARRLGSLPSASVAVLNSLLEGDGNGLQPGATCAASVATAATAASAATALTAASAAISTQHVDAVQVDNPLQAGRIPPTAALNASTTPYTVSPSPSSELSYAADSTPCAVWQALLLHPSPAPPSPAPAGGSTASAAAMPPPPQMSPSTAAAAAVAAVVASTTIIRPVAASAASTTQEAAPLRPSSSQALVSGPLPDTQRSSPAAVPDATRNRALASRRRRGGRVRTSRIRRAPAAAAAGANALSVSRYNSRPAAEPTAATASAQGRANPGLVGLGVAAAALGGVMGAGSGGVDMPGALPDAVHMQGAVSQFWEELDRLGNLASMGSLSSIDL